MPAVAQSQCRTSLDRERRHGVNRTAVNGSIVNLPELTKREQAILSYIEKREQELSKLPYPDKATAIKWQEAYDNRNGIYRILHSVEFSQ